MLRSVTYALPLVFLLFFTATPVLAHCEIPCGIYDDKMRISMLEEHITTIEKSMNMIKELEKDSNSNQLIRWVMNKEDHANQFQEIVSQYFLTQRIKDDHSDYGAKLEVLHQMLVYAMKCKQTTDLANSTKLKELVSRFDTLYFAPHE
ncbi:MAG TPA: superoxide dismutase [Ni] [Desulfopila sp.]|nr:superoxide dismutase [Ni] [Desulfopila sp.]